MQRINTSKLYIEIFVCAAHHLWVSPLFSSHTRRNVSVVAYVESYGIVDLKRPVQGASMQSSSPRVCCLRGQLAKALVATRGADVLSHCPRNSIESVGCAIASSANACERTSLSHVHERSPRFDPQKRKQESRQRADR